MRSLYIFILFLINTVGFNVPTAKAIQDSTYNGWYYVSREKLYQSINDNSYDIIFFGNSITERGPWEELLGARLKIGNRGIGGDNTFGMKARIQYVVQQKPKKIFLMMGINDLGRGFQAQKILSNTEEIIKIIQQKSPKTKIYLQSLLPLNDEVLTINYLKGKNGYIRQINEQLPILANRYRLTYVDVQSVLADNYVLKPKYTNDGIHLTTDAYIEWAKYLKANKYL